MGWKGAVKGQSGRLCATAHLWMVTRYCMPPTGLLAILLMYNNRTTTWVS